MLQRLDKLVAEGYGIGRSAARQAVRSGLVRVDGNVVLQPEAKTDSASEITLSGHETRLPEKIYIMMNKPSGVVSATDDPRQETVLTLLTEQLRRRGLFPAGRLDKDTTGLLILTDDGDFCHRVISPGSEIYKKYYAETDGKLTPADADAVKQGIDMADGTHFRPGKLEILPGGDCCHIWICEGKYHQVKRMLARLGKPVKMLKRVAVGGLTLDDALAPGQYRFLTENERSSIFDGDAPV